MDFTNIPLLSVAISVMICWALFAIVCSLIHEIIVSAKSERGRFMKNYLLQQLQDLSNGINWGSLVYMHGSVDMLSRSAEKPTSEISSKVFAETLLEIVGSSHIVQMQKDEEKVKLQYNHPTLQNFELATKVLLPSDVVTFFKQTLTAAELTSMGFNGVVDEGRLYLNLVKNIETWYNNLQSRITIWYKKKTKVRLFWLGLFLAVVLNVDSIQLFDQLNVNPNTRNAIINYYEKNETTLETLSKTISNDTTLQNAALKEQKDDSTQIRTLLNAMDTTNHFFKGMDSLSKAAVLPIGFNESIFLKINRTTITWSFLKMHWLRILMYLLGILLSAFAACVGAPFWFDLLKKIYSKNLKS